MVLSVENITFNRGEDGNLISQEVELEELSKINGKTPTVIIKPLTRGKLQELYAKASSGNVDDKLKADVEIIKFGLSEPKMNDNEMADIKPQYANAISTAIMAASLGISQKEVGEKAKELITTQELELKKK